MSNSLRIEQPLAVPEIARPFANTGKRRHSGLTPSSFEGPARARSRLSVGRERRLNRPSAFLLPSFLESIDWRYALRTSNNEQVFTTRASEALLGAFDLHSERDVRAFLAENVALLEVLTTASQEIQRVFGAVRPRLRFFQNPVEESDQKLYVCIPCAMPLDEAMRLLEELDQRWWNSAARFYGDRMAIDIEGA